ncbi:glycan-binding surface protein [Marinilongibacter aquaticus]|uniref:glycan-binding surface protein n=1 Tax=Marinilongibacter aquaticus TaxID=2975157 RepID=UPI0021BDBC83|nr:glycan-binding surface protein [Marinilongibacter aquaticus]UBM60590.1 glycan-binding surface protein [Marinilongibacter aquaticus]
MKRMTNKLLAKLFCLSFLAVFFLQGCSEEDSPNNGKPMISYIRVTDPGSSDSLIVSASQGALIAIIGENLGSARQIWFNDQRASLTPTYLTNESILVSVPSDIPEHISNTLKIYFAGGDSLLHDFVVDISEPAIQNMNCEYVLDGEVATIRGNYFYAPLTVTFAGGKEAEIVDVEDKLLKVRVPEGAQPGQITVRSNFGETKSDFWFRDNRNIFLSSDPFTGWWNQSYVVSDPQAGDPIAINGNYIRVKQMISGWQWNEVAGGPPDAMGDISKNIPDEAILNPEKYNFKFEVNTMKPYAANVIKFTVGLTDFNNDQYLWNPPYDTKGEWQTVVIPFEEMAAAYKDSGFEMKVDPNGYYTRVLFHGPGDLDCDMSFDNFRIVPKVIED